MLKPAVPRHPRHRLPNLMPLPARETLAKITLAPLLLAQGRYTRWATPKLAEPAGPREGVEGSGPHLNLLVLGDSAAAGVGVAHQSQALTGHLVATLARSHQVTWSLRAQTGLQAQDLRTVVANEPSRPIDVVVVSVGVNDITAGTPVHVWSQTLEALIAELSAKFEQPHILLSGVPPMRHFRALPQPLRWFLGLHADRFNQHLQQIAAQHAECTLLAPEFPTVAEYLASDGFHPGAPAYALWARAAVPLILERPRVDATALA